MKIRAFSSFLFAAVMLSMVVLPLSSFSADNPPEKKKEPAKDYSPYPPPDSGYVTDNANLLTKDQEECIEKWLWQTESKTGVEIIVVTIYSIKDYKGTDNSSIESFAKGLFDKYGIGNLPKNDGILLLIAVRDRKARIELGKHYGNSRDKDASRIMQNVIIPEFRKDNYAAGITEGVKAILKDFAPEPKTSVKK
jgi:uncharacterized protein